MCLVSAMRAAVLEMSAAQYAHMLSDSEDEQKALKVRMNGLADTLTATRKKYEPLVASAAERSAYEALTQRWNDYLTGNERCCHCQAISAPRRCRMASD